MIGPKNAHREPVMDQDYLVEGIHRPINVASKLSLETVIKMGALDAFVPVGPNRYRLVAGRAAKPELIVDAEGSIWMRSGNRDMFIRVAADEPPSPDEKKDREEEDEDDISAGFDETFGEEADEEENKYPHRDEAGDVADPVTEIPGTADNPIREMNNEPIPPPQGNELDMSPIGPTHSNDVMVFQTFSPGKTPKPTLKERVQEHAQEGQELRDELIELVTDVQEVIELAQGGQPDSDELTVVLETAPAYKNMLIPAEQSNDPMSPTFALYGSQKQAADEDDPEDFPPDAEQGARDAAKHAFATTVSVSGDTDAAHDAAYEAAVQALTPFIQDIGKVEQLAQAIMSDMRTAPKMSAVPVNRKQAADPEWMNDKRITDVLGTPSTRLQHNDPAWMSDPRITDVLAEPQEETNPRGWGSLPSSDPEVAAEEWGSLPSYDQDRPKKPKQAAEDIDGVGYGDTGKDSAESESNVHHDADLDDSEKLDLILRELEEVEEAVGINESPEEEAAEENDAAAELSEEDGVEP